MRELVDIAKVLSDETRLRMLKLLLEREICVCEMLEIIELSESQISRNFKMLAEVGFLRRWRDGRCIVYAIDRESGNGYCEAVLDLLAKSYNEHELVRKDRERLRQVIAEQVREKRR